MLDPNQREEWVLQVFSQESSTKSSNKITHPLLLFDKSVCRNCLCEEGKKLVIFPGTGRANKSFQQAVLLIEIDLMLEVVSVPSWECRLGRGCPLQLTSHVIQVRAERVI